MSAPNVLPLEEYVPRRFSPDELSADTAEWIWRHYSTQIAIDFPSPKTEGRWQLTPQGWIGHIPLGEAFSISLRPKVPLENVFRLLEYAYGLKSFRFLDGVIDCDAIEEVYQRLAQVLARRVLDRTRRGLHRTYVGETEHLPFVRERMDVAHSLRRPWDVRLRCHYHEHTADTEDNQILAWTLLVILRSGLCHDEALSTVRRAFRHLQGSVTVRPLTPVVCIGRLYDRLNADYEVLHALCRFFLEHTGPSLNAGDHTMLPFLVNMGGLFETFVAEWLKRHLPPHLRVQAHERHDVGGRTTFDMDLVLYDTRRADTAGALCILDTKYKAAGTPSADDIAQVVAYAVAKDCPDAVLVYPAPLQRALDTKIGNVRVRSLTFSIGGDIEDAGQNFLRDLLQR